MRQNRKNIDLKIICENFGFGFAKAEIDRAFLVAVPFYFFSLAVITSLFFLQ